MPGWSFAAIWNGIAEVVPEREAVVCGDRVVSWREFDDRAARLASHLWSNGVRAGDKVAIVCTNRPEYLETFFGALKLGAVPVNVNYRYVTEEMRYVFDNSDAAAVIHDPAFSETVHAALALLDGQKPVALETGEAYDAALEASAATGPWQEHAPDGDDLIFLYTGGTTGMPKGVMWRNDDLYESLWRITRPGREPTDPVEAVRNGKRAGTAFPVCPLMHGTGQHTAIATLAGGGTVVVVDKIGLDAPLVWTETERHGVNILTIVGDAFALPLLAALDAEPDRWDLSRLRAITSSGMTWSPETKAGLLRHAPHVTMVDSLGASEGLMTRTESTADSDIKPARFTVNDRVKVLDEHSGREVKPGSGEVGMVAVTGALPLGYYKDPDKSAATFRTFDGVRYSVPGDYATVDDDGTIQLLGRGSACINTGGEKVYPEEVETVLREHPSIYDCVIVGVPDERFGEMVVALVQSTGDDELDEQTLREWCGSRLSGYKRPKRWFIVESLERNAAAKADYKRLRALAKDLVAGS